MCIRDRYDRIVDRNLLIRRINITANRLVDESSVKKEEVYEQLDLFADYEMCIRDRSGVVPSGLMENGSM